MIILYGGVDSGGATLNGLRERGGSAWGRDSQLALIFSQYIARLFTVRKSTATVTAGRLESYSNSSLIKRRKTPRLLTSLLYFWSHIKLSKSTCGFTKFCSVWLFWFTQVSFSSSSIRQSFFLGIMYHVLQ